MKYRPLGKTGLHVSIISLGTVSLGVDYGIQVPGKFGRPAEAEALKLVQQALDAGINLFDTAPAYGTSEDLLGKALGKNSDFYIATKVSIPTDADGNQLYGDALQNRIEESIGNSLRTLRRQALDIVQIHNATAEIIAQGELIEALLQMKDQGKIRCIGASVYGEESALAVIRAGCFDVLQAAYSLLDQRMAERVFPAADQAGVGIMARSVLLKGALTTKAEWLPPELSALRRAAERIKETMAGSWDALPQTAVRFCLSEPRVSSVLVGAGSGEELQQAIAAANDGPLPDELLSRASDVALRDEHLLNPSYWSVP